MIESKRMNLVDTDGYTIDLEYTKEFAILHLPRVEKFNRTVYVTALEKIEEFKEFFTTIGYNGIWAATMPEDSQTQKLVRKLGFEEIGLFEGLQVFYMKG